jgi:hypothetical protein
MMQHVQPIAIAVIVAAALLVSGCGGSERSGVAVTSSTGSSPPPSSEAANESPTLFVSGRLSDEVINALVDDAGNIDEQLRTQVVDAFVALPDDQQLAVLSDAITLTRTAG